MVSIYLLFAVGHLPILSALLAPSQRTCHHRVVLRAQDEGENEPDSLLSKLARPFGDEKPRSIFDRLTDTFSSSSDSGSPGFGSTEQPFVAPPFEATPSNLIKQAKAVIESDFGIRDASLLDDDFIWIGPTLERPLGKADYVVAGKFFDLRSTFPELDYRPHDFRIDSFDPLTVRLTARTVGTMRGELRLRNNVLRPTGRQMRCPPEAISMTFNAETGRVLKLCSGFTMDRLVGNTAGLCGVMAAAVTAGSPPSEWEIYPVPTVIQRFFGRPVSPIEETLSFVAPFPETVMVQLAKGIILSDMSAEDPTLLANDFTYWTPILGPIGKFDYLRDLARAEFDSVDPRATNFRVDPYDPYRVWADVQPLGMGYVGPPQAISFTFDDDGFCTRLTTSAVMDPSIGNAGGLGGVEGVKYARGSASPDFFTRPLPRALGRLRVSLLSPITGVRVDDYQLPKKRQPLVIQTEFETETDDDEPGFTVVKPVVDASITSMPPPTTATTETKLPRFDFDKAGQSIIESPLFKLPQTQNLGDVIDATFQRDQDRVAEENQRMIEEEARQQVEEQKRREAEERQKREAEQRQRREAEQRQRREAEQRQRREAEQRQRREAEQRQRQEALERQRKEAEERQRREAEDRQRRESEERQKQVTESIGRDAPQGRTSDEQPFSGLLKQVGSLTDSFRKQAETRRQEAATRQQEAAKKGAQTKKIVQRMKAEAQRKKALQAAETRRKNAPFSEALRLQAEARKAAAKEKKKQADERRRALEQQKRQAEQKRKAIAEARQRQLAEEKKKAEEKRRAEIATRERREAEEKRTAIERRRFEIQARRQQELEEKKKAEELRKAQIEARQRAEVEARRKAETAQQQREAEERRKAQEARQRREAEVRRKAEEARQQRALEEKKRTEEKKKAEERRKAEILARQRREADERLKSEEARQRREALERKRAEENRQRRDALAKRAEETRQRRELLERKKAEDKRKFEERKAEIQARQRREAEARKQAEAKRKAEIEARQRRATEEKKKAQAAARQKALNDLAKRRLSEEKRKKEANKKAALKDMALAQPGATIQLTLQRQERQAREALEALQKARPRATIALFGLGGDDKARPAQPAKKVPPKPTGASRKTAPRGVPTITRWRRNFDGSITGYISGSPSFTDGEKVTTSPISQKKINAGDVVKTVSGSRYFLD